MKKSLLIFTIMLAGGWGLRAQTPDASTATSPPREIPAAEPHVVQQTPKKPLSAAEARSLERDRREEVLQARQRAQSMSATKQRALEPAPPDKALVDTETQLAKTEPVVIPDAKADERPRDVAKREAAAAKREADAAKKAEDAAARLKAALADLEAERAKNGR